MAPSEALRALGNLGLWTDEELNAKKAEIRGHKTFGELLDEDHVQLAAIASEQELRRSDWGRQERLL